MTELYILDKTSAANHILSKNLHDNLCTFEISRSSVKNRYFLKFKDNLNADIECEQCPH